MRGVVAEPRPTALVVENASLAVWTALPIGQVVRYSRLMIDSYPSAADLDLTLFNHPAFAFFVLAFL